MEKKVCIIGAGSSGIAAAKTFFQSNIPFDCFEKGSKIGGNWLYGNDNGMSSSYYSLHINTSKQMMAFSDFPMPDSYPDYPNHELVFQYFEAYMDKFGFRNKISFNTTVERVEKIDENKYVVYTNKFPPKEYTDVIVANGHHWSPKWATFDGEFSGKISHSHYYKTYSGFENKRVLIVGIGNSAVDIACELTTVATSVTVSTRSGAYILPKYLFGKPTDHLTKPPLAFAPIFLQRLALNIALRLNVGKQSNYGMPIPNRSLLKEHPTISQEFLNKVGHGKIKIKPNIKKLMGEEIEFTDGSKVAFDHIIFSTGYKIEFPFFDKNLFNVEHNILNLYEYVVPVEHKGLYFIGFIQPIGAVMPLAEMQSVWISKVIEGSKNLPGSDSMKHWIENNQRKMKTRYGNALRHTLEVDFFPYKRNLKKLAGL